MLPVLVDIGILKIYTFGIFLILAFFWGTYLLWKNIRLTSYKEDEIFDGLFFSLGGGLFVGRLVYVLLHFNKFGINPLKFILINGYPGISLYGAILGGLLTFFIFSHIKKIKFMEVIDYLTSPLLVALAIGKIGSFVAGVEVGTKTGFLLALKYVNFDGHRHLTAFYEGILFFFGAYGAYQLIFAIRRERYRKGTSFFFFLWYFGLVYFLFDHLKEGRTYVAGQSVNWIVAAAFLLTFSIYFLYYLRYTIIGGAKRVTNLKLINGRKTERKAH